MAAPDTKGLAYFFVIKDNGPNAFGHEEYDLDRLKHIFLDKLGFEWKNEDFYVSDLTRMRWNHKLNQNESPQIDECSKCCVLCHMEKTLHDDPLVKYVMVGIRSHGGIFYGNEEINLELGTSVNVDEVIRDLDDEHFPALNGKIRILIFDKCRNDVLKRIEDPGDDGGQEDTNYVHDNARMIGKGDSTSTNTNTEVGAVAGGAYDEPTQKEFKFGKGHLVNEYLDPSSIYSSNQGEPVIKTQPKDFLVIYSTTMGRPCYFDGFDGSKFLHSFASAIDNYKAGQKVNLLHVLTKTAYKMSVLPVEYDEDGIIEQGKMVCCTSSTLRSLPEFQIKNEETTTENNTN